MHKELTTQELTQKLERVISARSADIDPTSVNLRFCPSLDSCDGPSRSAVLRFRTYAWMSNPMGVTHGGIVAAILDASMGTLCVSLYGGMTPTITMTTNYARPVPLDSEVLVRVRPTYTGGTNAQLSAEMYLPDRPNDPLATCTGVYYTAASTK